MEDWIADNIDKMRGLAQTGMCDHCLGRMFGKMGTGMTNDERGRLIREALEDEGVEALKLCDKAILADIYAAREQNTYGISSKDIADALDGGEYYDSFEKIEARLLEIAQPGDLIITMGAGNVNAIGPAICAGE